MAKRRLIQAINDTLFEEFRRDSSVILFGEDVEISLFGDTRGLSQEFGPARIRNTPISEALITGMALGAAAAGHRVIAHLMFSNFMYTGFDSIANQASKLRYMTGGQVNFPVTYIAAYGGGKSIAAHHSDTPYPLLMNLGGINVVVPSTAFDAKGLLKTCIRGNDPSFFLEAGGRGGEMGEVPDEDYTIPLGKGVIRMEGTDVTIVAIGSMVKLAMTSVTGLSKNGISAEVIDPRTLVPLDEDMILSSVKKTGRLVIVDESRDRCSAASHIAAIVADRAFNDLKAPIKRVTVANVAMPYAPNLERLVMPSVDRISEIVTQLVES
jgi:pyruvate/2-oxoglutarate/acetoin dehydrogenase E1 component